VSRPDKWIGLNINEAYVLFLEQALEDIANPLAKLEREAAESGGELSPLAAQVANDIETIKDWARKALSR